MRIRIRDPYLFDPGTGMEKFGSGIIIPDPQHWSLMLKTLIGLSCILKYSSINFKILPNPSSRSEPWLKTSFENSKYLRSVHITYAARQNNLSYFLV